ncbi:MAG: bis(5'-nucleosyl)-tetraphosphatase (symmetrical) YqeK [Firmicutes bacterium]|nr:bis(5'-nucleosyl)-tetraphosphatase (symmetrical) YqeK [Bacillota bacterium]
MTLEDRFQALSAHRQGHIQRVMAVMEDLAKAHHLDREAARLAGYGHDLAREMARPQLVEEARRLDVHIGPEEQQEPLLLHGAIAARWLELEGAGSPVVWEAVRYHTTGRKNLDPLGQALFIADGVEPGRQYAERADLLQRALEDLAGGYCAVLEHTLAYLHARGLTPHPDMLDALSACRA